VKDMAQRLRLVISLFLTLVLTGISLATGTCALLCDLGFCCGAPPSEQSGGTHACCDKDKKQPEKKACCEWITKTKAPDQAIDVKIAAPPLLDLPILQPEAIRLPASAPLVEAVQLVPYEVRGPPGPELSQHHSRAPPVCRV
jgi:hypothetical protein